MASTSSQGTKHPLVGNSSTSNSGSSSAKKLKRESNFLQERFLDGKFSDITVKAFGREWKVHKVILSGRPYFLSLFEKGWKESQDQVIQLKIPDQKVTVEAVDACFRSLYAYAVEYDESTVIQLLAAASFFQLDDLIQKSREFMAESMDAGTVMEYYNASLVYGGEKTVENATLAFLKNWINTISFMEQLPKISSEMMAKVFGSSDVFCIGEAELYAILTMWLYMKATGSNLENADQLSKAFDYFRQLESSTSFLLTEDGKPYAEAFRQIRIRDLLSSKLSSVSQLRNDKILHEDWIKDAVIESWERIERGVGVIPISDFNETSFDEMCSREGIRIIKFANTSKKLLCFSAGLDLSCEKTGKNRVFKIKRVLGELQDNAKEKRDFYFRINLVVAETNGRIQFSTSSGIKKVSLKIGETSQLLQIGEEYDDYVFSIGIKYYVV